MTEAPGLCRLRIHHVRVDPGEVLVGATTIERWDWELEDAATAVNATDLVWVHLELGGPSTATTETIGLFPGRGTPERVAALSVIPALLDAAWRIVDEGWDSDRARREIYGLDLPRGGR
jgi:hypothetical protein